MKGEFVTIIADRVLEYYDAEHCYLVDGVRVPSITQIIKSKFGNMYANVDRDTLTRAAAHGTEVHEAIERYCVTGEDNGLQEVRNFKFLQKQYGFEVLENEVPVILHLYGEPVAAGRLDMVISIHGIIGGADIKSTTSLNREYLAYQLNLYAIAYRQCYGDVWRFLRGIQLKGNVRKFVDIPMNPDGAMILVHKYIVNEWRRNNAALSGLEE